MALTYVIRKPEVIPRANPEPRYVGSINDRPEREIRMARKFSTVADAVAYAEANPKLRGATIESVEGEMA